ncbi:MAG TPA: helix-turn-helix transcriptional regulator [Dehalococcoidia bacterium]|nr:helix-turn-helix transcriptional regulator [Dehalococcoidia bacterium]
MRRGRPRYPDVLTPREQEVLDLLREGLTNEQIAARLGISLAGAKYHVSEIISKLGVSNREEAARWAQQRRRSSGIWAAVKRSGPTVSKIALAAGAAAVTLAVAVGLLASGAADYLEPSEQDGGPPGEAIQLLPDLGDPAKQLEHDRDRSAFGPCQIRASASYPEVQRVGPLKTTVVLVRSLAECLPATAVQPCTANDVWPIPGYVQACDSNGILIRFQGEINAESNRASSSQPPSLPGGRPLPARPRVCSASRPMVLIGDRIAGGFECTIPPGDVSDVDEFRSGTKVRFEVCFTIRDVQSCAPFAYSIP